ADRGLLKVGMAADVVVFDPARVTDQATFEDPHRYAEGIDIVIVNGEVVVDEGRHTGATSGRVLRGPGYKDPALASRRTRKWFIHGEICDVRTDVIIVGDTHTRCIVTLSCQHE